MTAQQFNSCIPSQGVGFVVQKEHPVEDLFVRLRVKSFRPTKLLDRRGFVLSLSFAPSQSLHFPYVNST